MAKPVAVYSSLDAFRVAKQARAIALDQLDAVLRRRATIAAEVRQ